jgi:predicted O-methyltransferase YrrM
MKLYLRTRTWIVVTSLVCLITSLLWLTLLVFLENYHQSLYFKVERICRPFLKAVGLGPQQWPIHLALKPLDPSTAALLESMYDRQPQRGTDGSIYPLEEEDNKISAAEGMWLYELCRKIKPKQTLEIGLAYGFSTLYFLDALKANGMGTHVAVDPFEITDYHGIGLKKAQETGMDRSLRFIEATDIVGLPILIREGQKFEVIFIDGNHHFDYAILDFTISDYVCAKGGCIIFDDFWMPSIKKTVAFIERNRSDYQRQDTPIANIAVFKKLTDDRREKHFVPF